MRVIEVTTIFNSITNISEDIIEEAQKDVRLFSHKKKRNIAWSKWVAAAASLGIIALTAFAVFRFTAPSDAHLNLDDSALGESVPFEPLPTVVNTENTGDESVLLQNNEPIYYSALQLPNGGVKEELLEAFQGGASTASIASFREFRADGDSVDYIAILEGEITNIYLKHYDYKVAYDKFDEEQIFNYHYKTVVYEMCVDKVWFGDFAAGSTILVEDHTYWGTSLCGETFAIKQGHSYVIPIYQGSDELFLPPSETLVSGDITKDSNYSTYYPYHPQIEVTLDNYYIVPDEWETLAVPEATRIIMDVELEGEYGWYKDKMLILSEELFGTRMELLVQKILGIE